MTAPTTIRISVNPEGTPGHPLVAHKVQKPSVISREAAKSVSSSQEELEFHPKYPKKKIKVNTKIASG